MVPKNGIMTPVVQRSLAIKNEALRLGFSACGFAAVTELSEDAVRLKNWLSKNHHASMSYMENHFEKRTNPAKLVDGAKTVVSVLMNYHTKTVQADPEAPRISQYAYGTDYHLVIREKLNSLLDFMHRHFDAFQGRGFVDSAPVLDRAWAVRAGLGWIGKNSNLINRETGSFVFIGEILCDLELEYHETPESDFCGSCSSCIDHCPTSAILPNRTIDSGKCISYQTIENKEEIPLEFAGKFDNRVFGCDICQDVCPWNRKAPEHQEERFRPLTELMQMTKKDWYRMDEPAFKKLFNHSALLRTGFHGIRRTLRFLEK